MHAIGSLPRQPYNENITPIRTGRSMSPNRKSVKNSTGIMAAISGFLFALLYTGLEILTENPDATHSISIWPTPLIWLLAGILFYCVFYIVGTIRNGKVKERKVTFSLSVAVAILLVLFWLYPMFVTLIGCFGGNGC
jgi:hypothetical protein